MHPAVYLTHHSVSRQGEAQKQAALLQETANRIRTSADSLEAVIAKDAKDSASHARQSFQKVGTC
jgi:hypothetical protein